MPSIEAKPSVSDPMVSLDQFLRLALMIWSGLLIYCANEVNRVVALLLASGYVVGLIWA